jgi:hypothetical protein
VERGGVLDAHDSIVVRNEVGQYPQDVGFAGEVSVNGREMGYTWT